MNRQDIFRIHIFRYRKLVKGGIGMIQLLAMKKKRKLEKITLEQMAHALGYKNASGYYRVESGNVKLLAEQVPRVCKMLHMNYSDIFFEDQFSTSENEENADDKTNG
jgi:putative transcriptional regulator